MLEQEVKPIQEALAALQLWAWGALKPWAGADCQ